MIWSRWDWSPVASLRQVRPVNRLVNTWAESHGQNDDLRDFNIAADSFDPALPDLKVDFGGAAAVKSSQPIAKSAPGSTVQQNQVAIHLVASQGDKQKTALAKGRAALDSLRCSVLHFRLRQGGPSRFGLGVPFRLKLEGAPPAFKGRLH